MKKLIYRFGLTAIISLTGLLGVNIHAFAQEDKTPIRSQLREQLKDLNITLPFIDRDGDGINDLLQSRWGLKFIERFKNRRAIWEQLMAEGKIEEHLIDTNNDGTPDTPFRDFLRDKMNQQVDTDGDGVPDTPLREYMRKRFQSFDQDGDGIPDDLTAEQIRQHMAEMRQWREEIKNRLKQGLLTFSDDDGDGIPDNLPLSIFTRRHRKIK